MLLFHHYLHHWRWFFSGVCAHTFLVKCIFPILLSTKIKLLDYTHFYCFYWCLVFSVASSVQPLLRRHKTVFPNDGELGKWQFSAERWNHRQRESQRSVVDNYWRWAPFCLPICWVYMHLSMHRQRMSIAGLPPGNDTPNEPSNWRPCRLHFALSVTQLSGWGRGDYTHRCTNDCHHWARLFTGLHESAGHSLTQCLTVCC